MKITAKLGNSKRQPCSQQEEGYMYESKGVHSLKRKKTAKKEKKREDEKKAEGSFHSHMNRRNVSYVQGAKC